MEATQEQPRPRKRLAVNTACWECYRNHRGCDGLRPCKRCVDRGRATSCRDPAPDERIPRKRKRPKSNDGLHSREDRGKTSFKVTKQKFFIVDPESFLSSKPLINNETCFTTSPSSFPTTASNRCSQPLYLSMEIIVARSNQHKIEKKFKSFKGLLLQCFVLWAIPNQDSHNNSVSLVRDILRPLFSLRVSQHE